MKEYYNFKNEPGETGFLAGVVDVLSDNLDMICDYGNNFTADIFCIKDNDLSYLNNAVKKRLNYYNMENENKIPRERIDALDFKLKKSDADVKCYLQTMIEKVSSSPNAFKQIDEFLRDLECYLQKPFCVYESIKKQIET